MSRYRILVVVGSLRRESINRRVADALVKLGPADFSFERARISDLPLYDQDDDDAQAEPVKRLKREVRAAEGVIFATPEYNRSIPGVLKNALDNASRPYGDSAWAGKPAGIVSASPGAAGGAMAQQHLRSVLAYLDMPTLGQPEVFLQVKDDFFDHEGGFASERTRAFLQKWMDRYADWVRLHASG